jgi:hypothetical protein
MVLAYYIDVSLESSGSKCSHTIHKYMMNYISMPSDEILTNTTADEISSIKLL